MLSSSLEIVTGAADGEDQNPPFGETVISKVGMTHRAGHLSSAG